MCIIICKEDYKSVVSSDVLLKSATINPDGLGIVYLDDMSVHYRKSSEWGILRGEKRPYIAHFRYATVGANSADNLHPRPIGDTNCLLMQNGTVDNLGDLVESDTNHMARILANTHPDYWGDILEQTDCRWVIINQNAMEYELFNEDMWIERKGILYSKANVLDGEIVAVYGTLKRGYSNHSVMGTSSFLSNGETMNKYPMVCSSIPFVLPRMGEGHNVKVELYHVDKFDMKSIDALEGHPDNYVRRRVPIRTAEGDIVSAWLYFYPHDHVDNGEYEAEFTRGYNPSLYKSYGSLSSWGSTATFGNHNCSCSMPRPYLDDFDKQWVCSNCLGDLDNDDPYGENLPNNKPF